MSLHKECADHLRANYRHLTGKKLSAGHAHELVAAFFGYGTGAALRSETKYPLAAIEEAAILIPDLRLMDRRIQEIENLPGDLPPTDDLASRLCDFLVEEGYFTGEIWRTRDLAEHVSSRVRDNPSAIMDDLAGEMATTNAYFDGPDIDEIAIDVGEDALVATLSGTLDGEQDQDRAFHGDKIVFATTMTLERVAGRIAFFEPELDTGGGVDDSDYYDEELA
ncbi:hypothetical protein ACXR8U_33110 (plasmid) [Methylobacterium radiotolerans]